jgi:hypothetical protein
MLTEKDYCDKDLSNTLKELGYPTKMTFIGEQATIEIPINSGLIQLYEAQKWLREEKKMDVNAISDFISEYHWFWQIKSLINANNDVSYPYYRSYEEALSEGIKEAVKILKEK